MNGFKRIRHFCRYLIEQRGGDKHMANLFIPQGTGKIFGGQHNVFGNSHQFSPVEQRAPNFKGCRVKGSIGNLANSVLRLNVDVICIFNQANYRPVRNDHSLRPASGTGSVNNISAIRWLMVDLRIFTRKSFDVLRAGIESDDFGCVRRNIFFNSLLG